MVSVWGTTVRKHLFSLGLDLERTIWLCQIKNRRNLDRLTQAIIKNL